MYNKGAKCEEVGKKVEFNYFYQMFIKEYKIIWAENTKDKIS